MARIGRIGRTPSGVLPGLAVGVTPAPVPPSPIRSGPPPVARPAPRSATRPESRLEAVGAQAEEGFGFLAISALLGLAYGVVAGFRKSVRLLLHPHPGVATTAGAVILLLAVTVLPPAVAWLIYRRTWPPRRTSRWQGEVLADDPATQVELLASPAAAIGATVVMLGCSVALVVVAVLAAPLAWVGAVPGFVLAALLTRRMLRPRSLVVNRYGFGVRARRWDDRLAMPWSDVASIGRGTGDLVLVTTTPGPDGAPRPGIQLRRAGADADQLAALLTSYLEAYRAHPAPNGP